MTVDRRQTIAGLSATLGATLGTALTVPRLSFAATEHDRRLITVILRGGLDGLAAVPPYGDPNYRSARGELALPHPNRSDGVLDLDGLFALHPKLETLHGFYGQGQLVVFQAAASPYRDRSHFDAQNVLEGGGRRAFELSDGWLNRALGYLSPVGAEADGLAIGQNLPLIMRGAQDVTSWAPSPLPDADDDTIERLADLYQDDPVLSVALAKALSTDEMATEALEGLAQPNRRGGGRRNQSALFEFAVDATAKFLSADEGPRVAVLEVGGWDTHANQGVLTGPLATRLGVLDSGIARLSKSLGAIWDKTCVLIVSEFGRTVAANGTGGSDHGTGGAAFLAGGALQTSRVHAEWPGLGSRNLLDGRDLNPTTDMRSVFKSVLHDHMKISAAALHTDVFPESQEASIINDLIQS